MSWPRGDLTRNRTEYISPHQDPCIINIVHHTHRTHSSEKMKNLIDQSGKQTWKDGCIALSVMGSFSTPINKNFHSFKINECVHSDKNGGTWNYVFCVNVIYWYRWVKERVLVFFVSNMTGTCIHIFTSRVSGRGYRNGLVCVSVSVCVRVLELSWLNHLMEGRKI